MFLAKIRENSLVKVLYNLPGLTRFYHFLWAFFGALIYAFPSKKIFVIGVTGTKGKTTVLELLAAILEAANKKTALLSSLRVKVGEKSEKNRSGNTMPGRFYIQRFLYLAVKAGCKYALIEVTSQGVALHRHRFINWSAGILTNIAPEHIESHGSFEKYRKAKLDFLRYVSDCGGRIFLNSDEANSAFFVEALKKCRPIFYSKRDIESADVLRGTSETRTALDRAAATDFPWSDFNKENIAAAAALARGLDIGWAMIEKALRNFRGVPGRMEFLRRGGITAIIDYAHTPDSLKKVYAFLKGSRVKGQGSRLICVLGSAGGGRDKWKRSEMGEIAAEYCDEIILTKEDPYDENPEDIISQIQKGISENPRFNQRESAVHKIMDRREAIFKAIELAREGDIVVCTGKGSEDWIHLANGRRIPWSEKAAVEEALRLRR